LGEIRRQLERVQSVVEEMRARREGLDHRLKDAEELAKRAEKATDHLQGSLTVARPVLDNASRIASWLPWLPVIAGAAASGNLAPLVLFAGRALVSRYRRKHGAVNRATRPEVPQGLDKQVAPVVAESTSRQREYVPVEQPNGKLKALEEALKKVAQDYPGAINVVRAIESVADQIDTGMEKKDATA